MNKDLERFRNLLLTDEVFQKKLQDAASAYTGDQDEESIFNAVLVPLAEEYDISATFDEFKDYIQGLDGVEMSKDELSQVAGGKADGGGVGAGICAMLGIGYGAAAGKEGGTVCSVIGLGMGSSYCLTVGETGKI